MDANKTPLPSKNLLDLPEVCAQAVIAKVGYRALHRLPLVHSSLKEFMNKTDFPYEIEKMSIGKNGETVTVTVEDKVDSVTVIYTSHETGTMVSCGSMENFIPEQDYLSLAAAHLESVIKNQKTTIRRMEFKRGINVELVQKLQEAVKGESINALEFLFEGDIGMSSHLILLINPATIGKLIFQFTGHQVFESQPILQSPQWKAAKAIDAFETEFDNQTLENFKHFTVIYALIPDLTLQLYEELKQHFMSKPDFEVAFIRYKRFAQNIAPVVGLEEYAAIPGTDDVFFFHQAANISKFVRLHRSKVPANVTVVENW
ncbi:unnamed protein product [Caenorhabditis brenneri]